MCWKTSTPPPEPSPAAILLSTLSTVTEPQQFNVTEVSGPACPHTAILCNSSAIDCHEGIVCCDRYTTEPHCSCLAGWEPPDCLIQSYDAVFDHLPVPRPPEVLTTGLHLSTMLGYTDPAEVAGMSTYNDNIAGRIGIITFFFAVLLTIIIVVVVLLRRKLRRQPLGRTSRNVEQATELPERSVDRKTADPCSDRLLNSHSSKAEG